MIFDSLKDKIIKYRLDKKKGRKQAPDLKVIS